MSEANANPWVGILMGSRSDADTLAAASEILDALAIPHEVRAISAHRTPELAIEYAESAEGRGIEVIIAAAGGAAHLAGVLASKTILPVLGVPVIGWSLGGLDSLLSTVQMPKGVPVATLAIGKPGAANAALLAAQIIGNKRPEVRERLRAWRAARKQELLANTVIR